MSRANKFLQFSQECTLTRTYIGPLLNEKVLIYNYNVPADSKMTNEIHCNIEKNATHSTSMKAQNEKKMSTSKLQIYTNGNTASNIIYLQRVAFIRQYKQNSSLLRGTKTKFNYAEFNVISEGWYRMISFL